MQLTTDQRLKHLERRLQVLTDKQNLLHKEIKEQGKVIKDLLLNALASKDTQRETQREPEGNPAKIDWSNVNRAKDSELGQIS